MDLLTYLLWKTDQTTKADNDLKTDTDIADVVRTRKSLMDSVMRYFDVM